MKYEIKFDWDSIAIIDKDSGEEVLYWNRSEWREDPDVTFSIANAIRIALSDAKEFQDHLLRLRLAKAL